MGADGTSGITSQRGHQQHQHDSGDIARSIETQVNNVEVPAGNKNLMHPVANQVFSGQTNG